MCWSDEEDEAYTLQLHESLGITTACTEKTVQSRRLHWWYSYKLHLAQLSGQKGVFTRGLNWGMAAQYDWSWDHCWNSDMSLCLIATVRSREDIPTWGFFSSYHSCKSQYLTISPLLFQQWLVLNSKSRNGNGLWET